MLEPRLPHNRHAFDQLRKRQRQAIAVVLLVGLAMALVLPLLPTGWTVTAFLVVFVLFNVIFGWLEVSKTRIHFRDLAQRTVRVPDRSVPARAAALAPLLCLVLWRLALAVLVFFLFERFLEPRNWWVEVVSSVRAILIAACLLLPPVGLEARLLERMNAKNPEP